MFLNRIVDEIEILNIPVKLFPHKVTTLYIPPGLPPDVRAEARAFGQFKQSSVIATISSFFNNQKERLEKGEKEKEKEEKENTLNFPKLIICAHIDNNNFILIDYQSGMILEDYVGGILSAALDEFTGEKLHPDQWNLKGLDEEASRPVWAELAGGGDQSQLELARHELGDTIFEQLKQNYEAEERLLSSATMRYHERMVMLNVIDGLWKDHLLSMDHLKEGIGLRGYAQQDPLVAYKRESYDMFEAMMLKFQEDTVRFLFRMQILGPDGEPMGAAPEVPRPRGPVPAAPPVASAARPLTLDSEPREISISTWAAFDNAPTPAKNSSWPAGK